SNRDIAATRKARHSRAFLWFFCDMAVEVPRRRLRVGAAPCRPGIAFRSARASCPDSRAKRPCLLAAIPGRQDTAHRCPCRDALVASWFEATPVTWRRSFRARGCVKQRMDALRRRVSHGWLTEPGSNPWPGTTPSRRADVIACNLSLSPQGEPRPVFWCVVLTKLHHQPTEA